MAGNETTIEDTWDNDLEKINGIRTDCENPITKLKLGPYMSNENVYATNGPYLEFLKINLKQDTVKQVNIRKSQGFGGLIAFIGGLRLFLILFFGGIGSFISARLASGIIAR